MPNIAANEHVEVLEGPFGKGMVMKSNAQLQRFQAPRDQAPPIIPNPQATSSSGSSGSYISTHLNANIGLLQYQGLVIEAINKQLGDMEKDVEQVRTNLRTALRQILPEDQRDLVP